MEIEAWIARKARREASQVLFAALKMHAELIETLLREGAISAEAALPLVQQVKLFSSVRARSFEEGVDSIKETLEALDELIAQRRK